MSGKQNLFVLFCFVLFFSNNACSFLQCGGFQSSPCRLLVVWGQRWATQPWTECLHKWANLAAFHRAGPTHRLTGWLAGSFNHTQQTWMDTDRETHTHTHTTKMDRAGELPSGKVQNKISLFTTSWCSQLFPSRKTTNKQKKSWNEMKTGEEAEDHRPSQISKSGLWKHRLSCGLRNPYVSGC